MEDKKQNLINNGHVPLQRGIHQQQAINTYRKVLGANEEVLNILTHGYGPRWKNGPPPKMMFKNNSSAEREIIFVRSQISDWVSKGYVTKTEKIPEVVSPISVNVKTDAAGIF